MSDGNKGVCVGGPYDSVNMCYMLDFFPTDYLLGYKNGGYVWTPPDAWTWAAEAKKPVLELTREDVLDLDRLFEYYDGALMDCEVDLRAKVKKFLESNHA